MTNSSGLMLVCSGKALMIWFNQISFYNSSTEPAFTRSKSPTETPDECTRSVES